MGSPMSIGEADAIVAARKYADGRGYAAWRDGTIRTVRVVVGGHDCWRVMADDAPAPGEPEWIFEFDGGQSYLVDVDTGECIGVGRLNGHTLFVPAKA